MQKNKIHELRTTPHFFQDIKDGIKTFEIRRNDRGFKMGDEVLLKEYAPEDYFDMNQPAHYTGRILHRKIVYVLKAYQYEEGLQPNYVILSLEKI